MTTTTTAQLVPGTYQLTRDVKNTDADRRAKHDWTKAPVWGGGSYFIVEKFDENSAATITLLSSGRSIYPHDSRYSDLAAALERIFESTRQYLDRVCVSSGRCALRVIEYLLSEGVVSDADVISAINAVEGIQGAPSRPQ
jgi:hypothetical protein